MTLMINHVAQKDAQKASTNTTAQGVCGFLSSIHQAVRTITKIWNANGKSFFNFMDGLIRLYHLTVKDMKK